MENKKYSASNSKFRAFKKYLGVSIKGESDAIFDEKTLDAKKKLKDNIYGLEELFTQIDIIEKTSGPYFDAINKAKDLTFQIARRSGANDLAGNEQCETMYETFGNIINNSQFFSKQYLQLRYELLQCKKQLKEGEELLRDLRTRKTKLAQHDEEVQLLAQNKHRDRATKKLLDAQMSLQDMDRNVRHLQLKSEVKVDKANSQVSHTLINNISKSILNYCTYTETIQNEIATNYIIDHANTAMDCIKMDESRLDELQAQIENQESSIRKLHSLNNNNNNSNNSTTGDNNNNNNKKFFQHLCENKMPPGDPMLFQGEGLMMRVDNAIYISLNGKSLEEQHIPGAFILTTYRLLFMPYLSLVDEDDDDSDGNGNNNNTSGTRKKLTRKRGSSGSNIGINKYSTLIDLKDDKSSIIENITTDNDASENNNNNTVEDLSILSDIWDENFIFTIPTCAISRVEVIDEEEQQFGMWTERLEAFIVCLKYNNMGIKVTNVVKQIKPFAFGDKHTHFAYYYMKDNKKKIKNNNTKTRANNKNNGWKIYNPFDEYQRIGIGRSNTWRISTVNNDYELCSSYPRILVVPKSISDSQLMAVKSLRKRGRIPVCVWRVGCIKNIYEDPIYFNNENKDEVSIMRSAQPRISSHQTNMDVKLISMLAETSLEKDDDGNKICVIFDARPFYSAVGNFARGGGFENSLLYRDMRLINLDIQNIHSVREAWVQLNGLFSICQSKNMDFDLTQSRVESQIRNDKQATSWLAHVSQILCGAKIIANTVLNGCSVLIHCSDGWDRTAQLSALSQLFLDPYFRTIKGFQVLIEKEWCSFGHQFGLRTGQVHASAKTTENYLDKDRSPVFVQWLDSVWQCVQQMPNAYEFTPKMLEILFFHVYSCKYGTFLFNNEKERVENHVYEKTRSIWTDINDDGIMNEFINVNYEKYNGPLCNNLIDDKQILGLWPAYIDVRCKFHNA